MKTDFNADFTNYLNGRNAEFLDEIRSRKKSFCEWLEYDCSASNKAKLKCSLFLLKYL